MKYDSAVLERYAERLEERARLMTAVLALALGLIGVIFAALIVIGANGRYDFGETAALIGGIGVVIGMVEGYRRSLSYRVQAHTVLCEIEQERHLRKLVEAEKLG